MTVCTGFGTPYPETGTPWPKTGTPSNDILHIFPIYILVVCNGLLHLHHGPTERQRQPLSATAGKGLADILSTQTHFKQPPTPRQNGKKEEQKQGYWA